MTNANGMQPTFSGRHTQLFIFSDLFRVLTEFAEVRTDIARSILKSHYTPVTLIRPDFCRTNRSFADENVTTYSCMNIAIAVPKNNVSVFFYVK